VRVRSPTPVGAGRYYAPEFCKIDWLAASHRKRAFRFVRELGHLCYSSGARVGWRRGALSWLKPQDIWRIRRASCKHGHSSDRMRAHPTSKSQHGPRASRRSEALRAVHFVSHGTQHSGAGRSDRSVAPFHREAFGAASADLGESRGGFRRQARPCRGTFARVCGGAAPWLPPCPAKHQDGPCYRCDSRLTKIRCGSKSPCPTHNFWYLCEFGRFACGRPPLAACPTELPN